MEAHPLAEEYPPLTGEEYAALKADMRVNKQRVKIILFQGKILDGRHRFRVACELGLIPETEEFRGSEEEAARLVESLNDNRRHNAEERRARRAKRVQELNAKGMSQRAIAEQLGVSAMTVNTDLKRQVYSAFTADPEPEPPPCPTPPTPSAPSSPASPQVPQKVEGRDGKKYPAKKAPREHERRAAKPQKVAPKTEPPNPEPDARPPWADLTDQLSRVASLIEAMTLPKEQEKEPWKLIESLETTARTLLRKAHALRQRHHI